MNELLGAIAAHDIVGDVNDVGHDTAGRAVLFDTLLVVSAISPANFDAKPMSQFVDQSI